MGEAKRRLTAGDVRTIATEMTKRLTDEGKLVEAGWVAFRHLVIAKDAPDVQVSEMRLAFFAGAEHVFSSMIAFMEEGEEPTEKDLKRMDQLHAELERYRQEMAAKYIHTKGSA